METAGAAGVTYFGGGHAYVRLMWSTSTQASAMLRYKGAGGLGDVLPMQVSGGIELLLLIQLYKTLLFVFPHANFLTV